jgi:hypothetical protein
MRHALFGWFVLGLWLTGCGNWPYGGTNPPSGLIEPEVQIDDPVPSSPACIQQRLGVSLWEETELGIPNDVGRWVEGFHTGSLIWSSNGNRTTITLEAWDLRAFLVKKKLSPGHVIDNGDLSCTSYLEITAQVELASHDGRIFQSGELTLRLYGGVEAFGTLYLSLDALDNYTPAAKGRCFQGLEVKVLLGDTGFSGSLSNDFTQGACDPALEGGAHVSTPAGHWGQRWQSY